MHLNLGKHTVNLDNVARTHEVESALNPATQKPEPAVRIVFADARLDHVELFGEQADAFRAFVAGKPDLFADLSAPPKPAPAPVVNKAPTPTPTPAPSTTVKV